MAKSNLIKFSVSDSNSFKGCPKAFFYRNVLGYELTSPPNFLALGTKYDKLLGLWDEHGYSVADSEIINLFADPHEAAEAEIILKEYESHFKDERLKPVEGGNQYGFGIELGDMRVTGYLDKLSMKEESHVVVERKTTSESIEDCSSYWNRLALDPQIRAYVWALRKKGLRAGWVRYEVIRKLSSTYSTKLSKKKEIPIDQYRSLLSSLDYKKKLVNHKWFYVDEEMTLEFEEEHRTTFGIFNLLRKSTGMSVEKDGMTLEDTHCLWPKHEQSCDNYGGCAYLPICKKETNFNNPTYSKKEARYNA